MSILRQATNEIPVAVGIPGDLKAVKVPASASVRDVLSKINVNLGNYENDRYGFFRRYVKNTAYLAVTDYSPLFGRPVVEWCIRTTELTSAQFQEYVQTSLDWISADYCHIYIGGERVCDLNQTVGKNQTVLIFRTIRTREIIAPMRNFDKAGMLEKLMFFFTAPAEEPAAQAAA